MKLHEMKVEVKEVEEEFEEEEEGDDSTEADLSISLGLLVETNNLLLALLDKRLYPRLNLSLTSYMRGEITRVTEEALAFLSTYDLKEEFDSEDWEGFAG